MQSNKSLSGILKILGEEIIKHVKVSYLDNMTFSTDFATKKPNYETLHHKDDTTL